MYLFIYNGGKGVGSTQEAELSDYRDASMYSKEHLQTGPPTDTDTDTDTHTQKHMDLSTSCGSADTGEPGQRRDANDRIQSSLQRSSRQPKLSSVSQTVQKAGFSATSPNL